MRKLVAILIVLTFVFTTVSAFAEELKRFERSPFNMFKEWMDGCGKRADGSCMMEIKNRESWRNREEIKNRVRTMGGGMRGMRKYE
jgi:hypothetical protein